MCTFLAYVAFNFKFNKATNRYKSIKTRKGVNTQLNVTVENHS